MGVGESPRGRDRDREKGCHGRRENLGNVREVAYEGGEAEKE